MKHLIDKNVFLSYMNKEEIQIEKPFNWGPQQPNFGPNENCVCYQSNFGLYDIDCNTQQCSVACKVSGYVKFDLDGICKGHFLYMN